MILKKMGTGVRYPPFGGEPVEFRQATFTLDDGHTLSVSQYPEEHPDWGVDALIGPGGVPHWVHSDGERAGLVVKAISDEYASRLNAEWDAGVRL